MSRIDQLIGVALAAMAILVSASPATARTQAAAFSSNLNAQERSVFEAWYVAQIAHDAALNGYWRKIVSRRAARKKKKRAGRRLLDSDYVTTLPPK